MRPAHVCMLRLVAPAQFLRISKVATVACAPLARAAPLRPRFTRAFTATSRVMASETKPRLGFVGTGIMGASMAGHLLAAGYEVTVYNRTVEKTAGLKEKGAKVAASPAEVGAASDIVFSIVGYPKDVREVILGEQGVLSTMKPGSVVVDMTTSQPGLAEEIYAAAAKVGIAAIDAPVSGGDIGAREARLAIMCGGDREAFERVLPFFQLMGKNINLLGGAGAGQHTKMCNQILIAANMMGVVEAILYAEATGLDPASVVAAVGTGAAGSFSLNVLGPRIVKGDFEPGFFISHFTKDLGIALEEAAKRNLALPCLAMAHQFYNAAKAQGMSAKGTQALYLALKRFNGL